MTPDPLKCSWVLFLLSVLCGGAAPVPASQPNREVDDLLHWIEHQPRTGGARGVSRVERDTAGQITGLDFSDLDIGNRLPQAAKIKTLQVLRLARVRPATLDLHSLGNLPELRGLNLEGQIMSDRSLEWVSGSPNLEAISLRSTQHVGSNLRFLSVLRHLYSINLVESDVNDADLAGLRGSPVVRLELWGTNISDAAIPPLLLLPDLKDVSLDWTRFTPAGVDRLQTLRRQLIISDAGLEKNPKGGGNGKRGP